MKTKFKPRKGRFALIKNTARSLRLLQAVHIGEGQAKKFLGRCFRVVRVRGPRIAGILTVELDEVYVPPSVLTSPRLCPVVKKAFTVTLTPCQ